MSRNKQWKPADNAIQPRGESTIADVVKRFELQGELKQNEVEVEALRTMLENAKPRVTSFVPSSCSCCTALREPGTNYSRVKHTRGSVRYCKCDFCGNTWKEE